MNLVRYHGVFAPNFKDRGLIVPKNTKVETTVAMVMELPPEIPSPLFQVKVRKGRMRWSAMLERAFKVDLTVCTNCEGRLEQIAVIKYGVVAKAILESLKGTIFDPREVTCERGRLSGPIFSEYEFDQRELW